MRDSQNSEPKRRVSDVILEIVIALVCVGVAAIAASGLRGKSSDETVIASQPTEVIVIETSIVTNIPLPVKVITNYKTNYITNYTQSEDKNYTVTVTNKVEQDDEKGLDPAQTYILGRTLNLW